MNDLDISRRSLLGAGLALAGAPAFAAGRAAPLPDHIDRSTYDQILREFRSIVGDQWAIGNDDNLAPYRKSYVPDIDGQHAPIGAVAPESVEQVQAILAVANTYRQPLWPVSTGRNFGYGATTTARPGQFILDLKRMNRILSVDPEMGTALVEPGVTYQQLHDYLRDNNIPLWLDVPTIGPIASPVGNTLDRGVGYTPYGEHFMVQCGMEVVLPSGEVMRTGMGSIEGSNTWQNFKWGYGPYVDGLFTQSNFGIVTKMGMWLMPRPPAFKPFVFRNQTFEGLTALIDAIRPLRVGSVIPNGILTMGALYQVSMFRSRAEIYDNPAGTLPDDILRRIAAEEGLGMWNTYFGLYGTEQTIAATEPVLRAVLGQVEGELLTEAEMGGNRYFEHHKTLMMGGMSLEELGILKWRGGAGGMLCFAPVAQPRGSEATAQSALAKEILARFGFDYAVAYAIGWRDLHHIIFIQYDKADKQQERKAMDCYVEMATRFAERGWGSYRTGVQGMDLVARQFGKVNQRFNKTLKDAIDPNGIIAPGKSGIV